MKRVSSLSGWRGALNRASWRTVVRASVSQGLSLGLWNSLSMSLSMSLSLGLALSAATSSAFADEASAPHPLQSFARHFALQLQDGASYYTLTLPASVYTASQRSDLGDVRIFNGAGEPVPYSLDAPPEPPRTPPALREARWFPLPPTNAGSGSGSADSANNGRLPVGVTIAADGSLRATSSPPPRAQHDTDLVDGGNAAHAGRVSAIVIGLRDDNYQGRVSVESSDDLRNWQAAGDAQLLKVNYNGSTLSQDRIELNGAHARYLRLRWLDGVPYVDSLKIEVQPAGADSAQRTDAQRVWREGIVAHAGPKPGEYFFESGGPYPVDRLRLNLPQPNTVAPALVYSRSGLSQTWREVSSATLYRLHNGDVEQDNPSLEMKPDTDRQWRVVVDARNGGLGTGTLSASVGWRPATVTFVARGAGPFTLAVGNSSAIPSAMSRAELVMGASAVPALAHVGEALDAASGVSFSLTADDADARRRYFLWGALVLAVGSLGAIAFRLARGAQKHGQGEAGATATVRPVDGSTGVAGGAGASVTGTSGVSNVSGVSAAGNVPTAGASAASTPGETSSADIERRTDGAV